MNLAFVLPLVLFASPAKQAEALFSYVTTPRITLYEWRTMMDNTDYVWLVGEFPKGEVYCTRIAPNGKKVLDLIPFPGTYALGNNPITDRWSNLYIVYSPEYPIKLIRVSAKGEIQNYVLTDKGEGATFEAYLEILPGDTLLLTQGYHNYCVVKCLVTREGLIPLSEAGYGSSVALSALQNRDDYYLFIPDWEESRGLSTFIWPESAMAVLNLARLKLNPEESWKYEKLGRFPWRDYIWRSYPDVWIGRMTYARHRDGGYVLCIPDPIDSSSTHLLRLDDNGLLLDPSSLSEGGTYLPRSFTRLPESAKPYVELKVWQKLKDGCPTFEPDSALVVFWGCDDDGNLYAYKKVKKF